jgi:hypothetical protein
MSLLFNGNTPPPLEDVEEEVEEEEEIFREVSLLNT